MQQIYFDVSLYFKLLMCCHSDFLIAHVVLVEVIFLFSLPVRTGSLRLLVMYATSGLLLEYKG